MPFSALNALTVNCNNVINEQIVPATYYQYNGGSVNAISSSRGSRSRTSPRSTAVKAGPTALLRQQEQVAPAPGPRNTRTSPTGSSTTEPACTLRSPPPARPSRRRATACGSDTRASARPRQPGSTTSIRKPGARRACLQRSRPGELLQLALRRPGDLFHALEARAGRHR